MANGGFEHDSMASPREYGVANVGMSKRRVHMKPAVFGSLSSRSIVEEVKGNDALQRFGEESEKGGNFEDAEQVPMKWVEVADKLQREYRFNGSQRDSILQVE